MSNYEYLVDDEIYPVEATLWGTNAYLFPCDVRGGTQANCICANKVKAFDEKRLGGIIEECVGALRSGTCKAKEMRREEEIAGKAIYFVNRKKLQAANDARDALIRAAAPAKWGEKKAAPSRPAPRMYDAVPQQKTEHVTPQVKTQPSVSSASFSDGGDYAAAINRAMSEAAVESKQDKVESKAPPVIDASPAKAGMSLIEMARQRMAAKV